MSNADVSCGLGASPRIVHLHVPKTAGVAFLEAFTEAFGKNLRAYPERFEKDFGRRPYTNFNFFSGHIGYKVAAEIGGDLITVLRDPVERFLSTYFFMRQLYSSGDEVSHKTSLAARYGLDQFVQIRDEPILSHELQNRMVWQLAYSHRLEMRRELTDRGMDDVAIVQIAIANLSKFAIVGDQSDMDGLAASVSQRYGAEITIRQVNATRMRAAKSDLSRQTLDSIERWVHLDRALYDGWNLRRSDPGKLLLQR